MSSREDIVKQSLEQDLPIDLINLITQYDAPQSAAELLTVHAELLQQVILAWENEVLKDRNFFCGKGPPNCDQIILLSKYKGILEAIANETPYTYTNDRLNYYYGGDPASYSGMTFEDPSQALKMILTGNPVQTYGLILKIENLCDLLEALATIITPQEHNNFRKLFEASCVLAGYDLMHLSHDDAQLLAQELLEKNLITTTQASNLQLSDAEQLKHFKLGVHQLLVTEKAVENNTSYFFNKELLEKAGDRNRYLHYNGKVCVMNVTASEQQTLTEILKKQADQQKRPLPMSTMLTKGPIFSSTSETSKNKKQSDAKKSKNKKVYSDSNSTHHAPTCLKGSCLMQ